jgi:hypothetical protein
MAQLVWLSHLKLQVSTLCSASLVAQFFLLTIQSSIAVFATSWFAMNKAQDMLQLDMHKSLDVLVSALQHQAPVQQIL